MGVCMMLNTREYKEIIAYMRENLEESKFTKLKEYLELKNWILVMLGELLSYNLTNTVEDELKVDLLNELSKLDLNILERIKDEYIK